MINSHEIHFLRFQCDICHFLFSQVRGLNLICSWPLFGLICVSFERNSHSMKKDDMRKHAYLLVNRRYKRNDKSNVHTHAKHALRKM